VIEFLIHLNGALAASLLCALLFVDELGVPLPFAPNEALLLVGGLLLGAGVLAPWLFLPLAFLAMLAGMVTGFAWAGAVGSERLQELAGRVGADRSYARASQRLRSTSPGGIALARLFPGVRVYATLAAGASGLPLRRFLTGAIPALVLWMVALILVGDLVGRPAQAALGRADSIILTGVLLIMLGAGAFLALRHVPRQRVDDDRLDGLPRWLLYVLALAVDLGIVATVVSGLVTVGGHFILLLRSLDGVAGASLVVMVGYVVAARRGAGATLGEGLFAVDLRSVLARRRRGQTSAGDEPEGDPALAVGRAEPAEVGSSSVPS
jgi:membrane-associated protein